MGTAAGLGTDLGAVQLDPGSRTLCGDHLIHAPAGDKQKYETMTVG